MPEIVSVSVPSNVQVRLGPQGPDDSAALATIALPKLIPIISVPEGKVNAAASIRAAAKAVIQRAMRFSFFSFKIILPFCSFLSFFIDSLPPFLSTIYPKSAYPHFRAFRVLQGI